MKRSELFSREWCDLVFEHRERGYGAYQLRRRAGRRYGVALAWVVAVALLGTFVPVGVAAWVRLRWAQDLGEAARELSQLAQLEAEAGYEIRHVATGRAVPRPKLTEQGSEAPPRVADVAEEEFTLGTDLPDSLVLAAAEPTEWTEHDSLHTELPEDLPVEGPQLMATDVVEQMPQFPGGPKALMAWLESHVPYPKALRDRGVEGDMEVTFIVARGGQVIDVEVARSLHPELDAAVVRALRTMPRWTPGRVDGQVSLVRVTLPMRFEP